MEIKILNTSGATLYWDKADSLIAGIEDAIRKGIAFPAGDFRGMDLHGAKLCNGSFIGAHCEGANLIGTDFTNANCTDMDISGAAITESIWSGATTTGMDQDALATAAVATTAGTCIPTTEKAAASGVASLNAGSLVVQNPANATATPTASRIPMTGAGGAFLAEGWRRPTPTAVNIAAAPYVLLATDESLEITLGAGAQPVTLPTAVGCAGRRLKAKIVVTGGGTGNITPAGAEQIDGAGAGIAYALTLLNQSVEIESNNVGWNVLNAHPVPAAHAATAHRQGQSDEEKHPAVDTAAVTPFAVLVTHEVVLGAATAGAVQIVNLYAADAAAVGRTVRIWKTDENAQNVVPTPNGTNTIDGVNAAGASSTITVLRGFVDLYCSAVGAWLSAAKRLA